MRLLIIHMIKECACEPVRIYMCLENSLSLMTQRKFDKCMGIEDSLYNLNLEVLEKWVKKI